MIHELTEDHKEHLRRTGIATPPETIGIPEEEYAEHAANWGRVRHGGDLHAKILSHAAWKRQNQQPPAATASVPSHEPVVHYDIRWELRIIAFILFLLFSLLLIRPAKAQFSHISSISFQDSTGTQISGAFFTYPFSIKCLANMNCNVSGNVLSINAASGGTGCTLPGGSGLLLFDNVTACADVTKWSTNGTTTITAAATAVLDLSASSLVKLRFSSGATTSTNGDLAYDSLNAKWQIWQGAANKNLIAASNLGTSGQPCLSNADGSCTFADPVVSQPTASLLNAQVVGNIASAASDSGNPVKTGGVFNTTQPTVTTGQRVDQQMTARGAAIVGTGVDTFHVTVDSAPTTAITAASLPLPTGAATAAKQPALGTAGTASSDVITVQGIASMTPLKVDPSGVTSPVSLASLPALAAGANIIGKVGIDQTTPGTTNAVAVTNLPPTVDTNSGNKSASTLRMVLATDQPTMTNPQPVTPQIASGAAAGDTSHRQYVLPYPDTTTTSYHASKNVASAASATDIAVLPGNATNTVIVYRVQVTCTQTTAGIITLQLIKRSTADTAGTSSAITAVPDDSSYAAGVSAPLVYTANPTTGTAVGNLDTVLFGCMATGTTSPNDIYIFKPAKPIILRGTAQQLAVNLNGATVTGGSFNVTFDYAETTTP